RDNLAEFRAGFSDGWQVAQDPDDEADIPRAIDSGRFRFYIARVGGEVSGTAGLALKPRSGYFMGGNVLPRCRGTGVYRALVDARLRDLVAAGCPLATTQARELTSAPILEHLGWQTVFRFRVYRLDDPRAALA